MKNFLLSAAILFSAVAPVAAQPTASYNEPTPLRSLALISLSDGAVSNLLTRNPMNKQARMTAPIETEVKFQNTTNGAADIFLWDCPGVDGDYTATDFNAVYISDGVFPFPTLTAFQGSTQDSYKIEKSMKIGGNVEITTSDYSEWNKTYLLGCYPFNEEGAGYLGGPNTYDISGVGNLFMTAFPQAQLTGINIYFTNKPKLFEQDAYLTVQLYIPNITTTSVNFTAQPYDGDYLFIRDIEATTSDLWAPVQGGGVGRIVFDKPVDLEGVPIFFIGVDRLSEYDPAKNDFCILTDLIGRQITDNSDMQNLLAHNSFGRIKGEMDYAHPVSQLGGGTGIFQICPVLKVSDSDTGVGTVMQELPSLKVSKSGSALVVEAEKDGDVTVYNAAGAAVAAGHVLAGVCALDASALPAGLYIVRHSSGATAKVIL